MAPLDLEAVSATSSTRADRLSSPRSARFLGSLASPRAARVASSVLNSPRNALKGMGSAISDSADLLMEFVDGPEQRQAPTNSE